VMRLGARHAFTLLDRNLKLETGFHRLW
jgi:hypothetical protein